LLETRSDIDLHNLAFGGVSQAAGVAPFLVALEPRIKTAVLLSGGTCQKVAPEVDSWNYAPRVTVPVLMINGRSDFIFPLESTQLPLMRAPAARKAWRGLRPGGLDQGVSRLA
jgi:hypothetical protein